MNYNIHPIFVHFPIAFLFVYSVIKILPLRLWFPRVAWRQIERVLLVAGVAGAFIALYTGGIAEDLVHPNHQLVEAHSTFAGASTFLYAALLIGELAALINKGKNFLTRVNFLRVLFIWIEKILCNVYFSALLSVVGLICISVTGILGGVIAYGASSDPVAPMILKLLGITL